MKQLILMNQLTLMLFKQNLFERHPSIKSKKFQVAVNEEFVQDEDIIQPTDTVALIPPVSGG